MRTILTGLIVLALGSASVAAAEKPLAVPTDPRAKYTVVDIKMGADGNIEIVTHRIGPSGESYSKRLVNCRINKFKYLGDGDTIAEMNASKPSPNMSPLVEGSISDYVVKYACANKPK